MTPLWTGTVLGLDLAWVRTGWAVLGPAETLVASGTFTTTGHERPGARITAQVSALIAAHHPALVALEDHAGTAHMAGRAKATIIALAQAREACLQACDAAGITPVTLTPQAWRVCITGRGVGVGKRDVWAALKLQGFVEGDLPPVKEQRRGKRTVTLYADAAWDRVEAVGLALAAYRLKRAGQLEVPGRWSRAGRRAMQKGA